MAQKPATKTVVTSEDKKALAEDVLAIVVDIVTHQYFSLLSDVTKAAVQAVHMIMIEAPVIEEHTKVWLQNIKKHLDDIKEGKCEPECQTSSCCKNEKTTTKCCISTLK
jgi:hypothetical protein